MVRRPGRPSRCRIRRGRLKKLRRAFRKQISKQEGAVSIDEWFADLADEYPDEDWLSAEAEQEEDADASWHQLYFRAFEALRYDRTYGAFGGQTPISYLALSRYAADHGVTGEDFAIFQALMAALDAEWSEYTAANGPKN